MANGKGKSQQHVDRAQLHGGKKEPKVGKKETKSKKENNNLTSSEMQLLLKFVFKDSKKQGHKAGQDNRKT